MISSVLTLRRQSETSFSKESGQYDLVVGAKGSPLQLVLSSIYQLDIPTGNIPYSRYLALKKDRRISMAIPVGLGDNYHGFRIIGTEPSLFDLTDRGDINKKLFSFREGRSFQQDLEAVIGADVARQSGLKIGDSFVGTHGLVSTAGSSQHTDFPYRVVGILNSSGMSTDRGIYVSLSSVWRIHEKEAEIHAKLAGIDPVKGLSENREVTAVLLRLKAVGMRLWMTQEIQKRTESMAAIPVNELHRLFVRILEPVQNALLGIACLVVLVSALTIVATFYQAAERRRADLAIMRALGAHRREILALVLTEALILTVLGIGFGMLLGHGGLYAANQSLRNLWGVSIHPYELDRSELYSLSIIAVGGIIAGLLPAILAYRREPTDDLSKS
ncbi:ABC transporter permease [Luteolibacter pohnpeiensis]|uniref:ABC transporter permease n=1 Tax=Luteolibacter pohnpeiensis TaxID=454153 RepID=A0A934S8I6_9BACT|nr:ABC transporter permease [Luteolibacter pohnpeiensis]